MIPKKAPSAGLSAAVFAATWVVPIWPVEQALHSTLTVVAAALTWRYVRRHAMSDGEFFLVMLFLAAHSIAARWTYSNVPYDDWARALTGHTINATFGWTRNHFDRLIHILYGFCLTPTAIRYSIARWRLPPSHAFYAAITAIMLTSLWYEWFEWLVAVTLSAQDAEAYNGQQGDMWDAHKDMLLATLGSALWAAPALLRFPAESPNSQQTK